MKKISIILGLCVVPLLAYADDLPKRKPGLWEVSVASAGRPGQVMKQCTDETTDEKMMATGNSMANSLGVQCSKKEMKKAGDTFTAESECTMNGTKLTSKTVFSGDFNSQYTGETNASYDPPLMGMTGSQSTITARWLGPCEAGQKPGDMVMPGGHVVNMEMLNSKLGQLGAAAGRAPSARPMPPQ